MTECPKCGREMEQGVVQMGTAPRAHDVWVDLCSFCEVAIDANDELIEL